MWSKWRELVWCSVALHLFDIFDDLKMFETFHYWSLSSKEHRRLYDVIEGSL